MTSLTSQRREELLQQRRDAIRRLQQADDELALDATISNASLKGAESIMSRSASHRNWPMDSIDEHDLQRSLSTAARAIPQTEIYVPSSDTFWPMPSSSAQYVVYSPEEYLTANSSSEPSGPELKRPRGRTASSCHLLSPTSSFQTDTFSSQASSYLTSASSLYSADIRSLSPQSCELQQIPSMSRHSSLSGTLGGMGMMRLGSSASYVESSFLPFHMDELNDVKPQSAADFNDKAGMSLLSIGTGTQRTTDEILMGVGAATKQFELAHPLDHTSMLTLPTEKLEAVEMKRSGSGESVNSNLSISSSLSSRERKEAERRQRHIGNHKQALAPKVSFDSSSTKQQQKDKQAISKVPYKRKEARKIFCQHCNAYPNGFHGAHELRRHEERAHSIQRKVWICQTPPGPIASEDMPKKSLDECKQCGRGKQYNVYYNAAAHIRRAHFNPRKLGRCLRGETREARAGKAGGDKPSMEWLKDNGWIKEVQVYGPPPSTVGGTAQSTVDESTWADDDDDGLEPLEETGATVDFFDFNDMSCHMGTVFAQTGLFDDGCLQSSPFDPSLMSTNIEFLDL